MAQVLLSKSWSRGAGTWMSYSSDTGAGSRSGGCLLFVKQVQIVPVIVSFRIIDINVQ
jgi:xanthine/CO dehydrogenase XdhC/CoxF family maturation factor